MTDGAVTNSAVARWKGRWRCEVDAGGFSLEVDEPVRYGGTGAGPMPTDLLLASLSSCYALALVWAAGKQGVELPDLEVTAIGAYDGQRFGSFEVVVSTTAATEVIEPLIEPAERVCYVSRTLASPPAMSVSITRPSASPNPSANTPEAG